MKDIHEILVKAVGKEINKAAIKNFRVIFQYFKNDIIGQIEQSKEFTNFYQIEHEKDVDRLITELQEINKRRVEESMKKLSIKPAEDDNEEVGEPRKMIAHA